MFDGPYVNVFYVSAGCNMFRWKILIKHVGLWVTYKGYYKHVCKYSILEIIIKGKYFGSSTKITSCFYS